MPYPYVVEKPAAPPKVFHTEAARDDGRAWGLIWMHRDRGETIARAARVFIDAGSAGEQAPRPAAHHGRVRPSSDNCRMARQKPRHHYLPAAFIGRFSSAPARQARESLVWVRNRGVGLPFLEKAKNVGHVRGLYGTPKSTAGSAEEHSAEHWNIDAAWRHVENRLSSAIDLLLAADGALDAHVFGEVLVPFVAALFVRGWEFDERFTRRMDGLFGTDTDLHAQFTSRENVNHARLMEMQRLCSPVMRAAWTVMSNVSDVPLLTSDLAVIPWIAQEHNAMVVALDPWHALRLDARPLCSRIALGADKWVVDIDRDEMSRVDAIRANRTSARVAPRQIYGPTEASIVSQQVEMLQRRPAAEPEGAWGVPGKYLARTDLELFDFLVEIAQPPDELPRLSREEATARIKWPLPMVALGTNKDTIYSDDEETELRLREIVERKSELDRLANRFGPMEILATPR